MNIAGSLNQNRFPTAFEQVFLQTAPLCFRLGRSGRVASGDLGAGLVKAADLWTRQMFWMARHVFTSRALSRPVKGFIALLLNVLTFIYFFLANASLKMCRHFGASKEEAFVSVCV